MDFDKYFTPLEATRTLPLVRRIVADILATGTSLHQMILERGVDRGSPEVLAVHKRLQAYLDELRELGCEFKGYRHDVGLVDFPARIEGETVLLCWKSDEDELRFYHSLEDGFAGRRPIPAEYFADENQANQTST